MADISQIKIGITTYNIKDSASYKKPSGGIPSSDLALFSNLENVGTSKYLREDGTWAEPVGGGNITTPTLLTTPTSSTITYTKDGNTLNFYIGQFCRVADATMDTGYKFYQLADLNNGVAAWQEMGTPLERTALSVTTNNPSLLTSLRSSAVITVTDENDNEVFSGTLPQTRTLKLTPGISYTVSAAPVTGYATPSDQTFGAEYEGIRSIDMEYDTTILTVVLASDTGEADLSDVTITVTDTTASSIISAQQDGSYLFPTGHEYSVAVSDDVEGYSAPFPATGTASGTATSVTMIYTEFTGYIDLELPSGTLWATGNIVQDGNGGYKIGEETDYGAYFSWGNIVPHFSTNGSTFDDGYNWGDSMDGSYASTAGASLNGDIQLGDALHDAALALLGAPWHLPHYGDYQELINNTDKEWTTIDGVTGYKFMKKTDHSIYVFFPALGTGKGANITQKGTNGRYWTRNIWSNDTTQGMVLDFYNGSAFCWSNHYRYRGDGVRAVFKPVSSITITLNPTDGTSVVGKTVIVTDSEGMAHTGTIDPNGMASIRNVTNGECTVSVADYVVYNSGKITVTNSTKSFTIQVVYRNVGVYAYYSDGTLKTEAEANTDAIGVAVITSNCSFIIDKNVTSNNEEIVFGGYNKNLSNIGVVVSSDSTIASADFDGEGNTTKIINACAGYTYNGVTGAIACEACRAAFDGRGYMGSLGEWKEAYNNIAAVNSMLTKVGGNTVAITWYWCSTLYDNSNNTYVVSTLNGNCQSGGRRNSSHIRAFRSF